MSTSAIVMMLIGCIGLWGGCALAISIAIRYNKKNSQRDGSEKDKE